MELPHEQRITEKLSEMANVQMKKFVSRFFETSTARNLETIERGFLNLTSSRWRFSKIHKHFKDRQRLNLSFRDFIENMKNSSKDSAEEMENLLSEEKKDEITTKAFNEYMTNISDMMRRRMDRYKTRLDKGRMSCIMTQVKKSVERTKTEIQTLVNDFNAKNFDEFDEEIESYVRKIIDCSDTISENYENCLKSEGFEECLENYIQVFC